MPKKARRLNISLATKCQLLFGVAVVLVVMAALFVPWQRMETLSEQPNESAAKLLADAVLQDHVKAAGQTDLRLPSFSPTLIPTTQQADAAWQRRALIAVDKVGDARITRFESAAIRFFKQNPDRRSFIRGGDRYRYARALTARDSCLQCHAPPPFSPTLRQMPIDPPLIGIVAIDIPSQSSGQQQLLNRVLLLIAALIAGALAGVTLYLIITRIILRPVRILQETAEKVSAGDLNIRSHINSGDEFQQLSETFNEMLATLKGSNDKLTAMNKSLDVRLGQLAEANDALFQSNKLKTEFLANVSHELRTPLNSILGFADLLRDGIPTDAKQARYLQNIIKAGHNLLDLINDLLDLAKIEAGKLDVRVQPLSLSDLFEGLVNLLRPLLEPKKLTVDVKIESDVPVVQTDPSRLQQVLYNLLSNAIKFSPTGSVIELTAEQRPNDRVRLYVIDHGPGIAPAMQGVIFEKFRQGDQSHTREHGGTGLGLAIARELAGLLGGAVGVESEVGKGARFWC
ncbi:MAG: putative two-component system sensor histidine kinase, partial [Phycisphaerales bacterium]|nr:putative two-component system sensor histidine kinase [Phycisphaerales bacterium]